MKACPISGDYDIPSQECFNSFPLLFLEDQTYPQMVKDDNYRGRSYCYWGHEQQFGGNPAGTYYRLRYRLPPNLNGNRVLLQWHYVTGNTCFDEGYRQYDHFPAMQPMLADCHQPLPADGAVGGTLLLYKPEQFWNCAEVKIVPGDGANPTPIPAPPNTVPVPAPLIETLPPTASGRNVCGTHWIDAQRTCPVKECTSSVDCPSGKYCFSAIRCTPQTEVPVIPGSDYFYCGKDRIDAASKCGTVEATPCPSGMDSDCPEEEFCLQKIFECSGTTQYCGLSPQDSANQCSLPCPNGDADCESGETCHETGTSCDQTYADPAPSPENSGGSMPIGPNTNHCGSSWSDADSRCSVQCPMGTDSECPSGQRCYADTCGTGSGPIAYHLYAGNVEPNYNWCGTTWLDAKDRCHKPCPTGFNSECGIGEESGLPEVCFVDTRVCGLNNGATGMPTPAPVTNAPITPATLPPVPVLPPTPSCLEEDSMQVNLGYWESWSVWRAPGCNRMYPEDIDVVGNGYTHLVYSFAAVGANFEIEPYNAATSEEVPMYQRFNAIKQTHQSLKTLIGVGGWTHNDPGTYCRRFAEMAATPERRQTFAQSVVNFCRTHGFDGVDLDWEYPGDLGRCGTINDKANYGLMVQEIRSAFNSRPETQDFLITMAVPANIPYLERGYHLQSLGINLDYVNLMSYDIAGTWSAEVGSHTDMSSIRPTVDFMLSQGIPSTKLVLGLAAYARTFSLNDPETCSTVGCPFSGARGGGCVVGNAVGYTPLVTINEIIESGTYASLELNRNTESMELVTNEGEFISFDNQDTLSMKAAYAGTKCLGGYMWWAVDLIAESFTLEYSPTISPSPTISRSPTNSPTISAQPSVSPTFAPPKCCGPNETKMKSYKHCTQYYWCNRGVISEEVVGPYSGYRFNEGIQNWDIGDFTCHSSCGEPEPTPPPPPAEPSPSTRQPQQPPSGPSDKCCPHSLGYTMRSYNDCSQYYWCLNGEVLNSEVVGPLEGLVFNEVKQNWDYTTEYSCPGDPCHPTSSTLPPTPPPTSSQPEPPSSGGMCCAAGETKMKAYNGCLQYYWCYSGVVNDYLTSSSPGYLFDESIQNWVLLEGIFTCQVDPCDGSTPPPTPLPTPPPTAPPQAAPGPPAQCCDENEYAMRAIDDCKRYYWCYYGEPYVDIVGPYPNYKFDEAVQNWVWDDGTFVCPGEPCGEATG